MDAVLHWVSTYGYVAIFGLLVLGIVGLPVPDEWLLVFSGYLVYSGRLSLAGALSAAILGSTVGITLSYLIGRTIGLPLIHSKFGHRLHISGQQIQRVHDWFNRIGHWALFAGYFIPGVRHFTALVAGTSCLEFPSFALYAYGGAVFWVCTFMFLGLHFGEHWQTVFQAIEDHIRVATVAASIVGVCYLLWRYAARKARRPG
ncbi:MAG: DedA family protein [Bryobacteraceae bacterium]